MKTGSQGECKVPLHQNIGKRPASPTGRKGFECGPECKHATVTSDLFRAHPILDTEPVVLRGGHSGMRLEL